MSSPNQTLDNIIRSHPPALQDLCDALRIACVLLQADSCHLTFDFPHLGTSLYACAVRDGEKLCMHLKWQDDAASAGGVDSVETSGVT